MKYGRWIRTAAILGALCMGAHAQWSLTWYVDRDDPNGLSSPNYITNNTGLQINPLAVGNTVYLMSAGADGILQGLDGVGTLLGDDSIVQLYGGGNTTATIGSDDFPFNNRGAGEMYRDSTIQDAYMGSNLYILAFQQFVQWSPGLGRFLSTGYYGTSSLWTAGNQTTQTHDFGNTNWGTTQSLIPEPTTLALLGAGLAGIVAYRRKKTA